METLIKRLNTDDMLRRHGAYYTTQLSIVSGDDISRFDIKQGRVSKADRELPSSGFALVGSPEVWVKYCQDIPPPEYHELGAMLAMGHVTIQGDMYAMQSNFMFVRRLLELWREDQRRKDRRRENQQEQGK
ncbi:MAG: hypothetical protein O6945_02675 [Gammaproteobacteria bacterium]|nr:hypothetical protein [Gammaproteobacteria bacterium]